MIEILRHGSAFGCKWHAAVVMDDHVHALMTPGPGTDSSRLVHAWKSASSHRLVKEFGRRAPVWQAEYYQRWIWSADGVEVCARYIRGNPARRWPGEMRYPWVLP
jgi:REP element-mobilizing transposase RayT